MLKARREPTFRSGAVIEPGCTVAKIRSAATPSKRPASRKGFADLPPAAGEFKQAENLSRFVSVLVSNDGNAGDPTAGIELDPDRLNLASDPVLQANRERVAAMHNRTAASEKRASPFLRTRHQRFLALVQNKDCQLLYSEEAFTGLVTVSPWRVRTEEAFGRRS
jgi:hypothetical protein